MLLLLASASAQNRKDLCHVYVVDVAKSRRILNSFHETGNREADAKTLSGGETVFPQFQTIIGEEQPTTKTYKFPGANLFITATVYYTDESMASSQGNDSMTLGIEVSRRAARDALVGENNAMAEVTDNDATDTVRAKKYVRVNRRLYLVGIECRCRERFSN